MKYRRKSHIYDQKRSFYVVQGKKIAKRKQEVWSLLNGDKMKGLHFYDSQPF